VGVAEAVALDEAVMEAVVEELGVAEDVSDCDAR